MNPPIKHSSDMTPREAWESLKTIWRIPAGTLAQVAAQGFRAGFAARPRWPGSLSALLVGSDAVDAHAAAEKRQRQAHLYWARRYQERQTRDGD